VFPNAIWILNVSQKQYCKEQRRKAIDMQAMKLWKNLIEVALPRKRINQDSARESPSGKTLVQLRINRTDMQQKDITMTCSDTYPELFKEAHR